MAGKSTISISFIVEEGKDGLKKLTLDAEALGKVMEQMKPKPSVADLKALRYDEWLAILKHFFWDRCKADQIQNASIALMMVDWCWLNGATTATRQMQAAFGLATDGIIGPKSLAALNGKPANVTFERLKTARERSYDKIVKARPSQMVFYNGWMNRTRSIKFEG